MKDQNAKFFAENIYLWEKLKNPVCPYCGDASVLKEIPVETYELQIENIRLKEELERVSLLKREIRSNNRMFPNFNSSSAAPSTSNSVTPINSVAGKNRVMLGTFLVRGRGL